MEKSIQMRSHISIRGCVLRSVRRSFSHTLGEIMQRFLAEDLIDVLNLKKDLKRVFEEVVDAANKMKSVAKKA